MRAMIFLVAAEVGRRFGDDLDLPALTLGIARVHAEQVRREQRRLVAARAGADFEEDVALVVGIPGQQHRLQFGLERHQASLGRAALLVGEIAHLRVAREFGGGREIGLGLSEIPVARGDGIELRALLRPRAIALEVARRVLGGEQRVELGQAPGELIELGAQRLFHADWMRRVRRCLRRACVGCVGCFG